MDNEQFVTGIVLTAMTAEEARTKTEGVRRSIASARSLLLELYEREGWKALGYSSWRAYGEVEFEYSESRLYQLMDAAKIERTLLSSESLFSTSVENNDNHDAIPEGQLRPLAHLEPEQQCAAWRTAVETAPGGKVTAAHVKRVVEQMERPKPEPAPVSGYYSPGWTQSASPKKMEEPTIPEPIVPIEPRQNMAIHYSSETPEHYTPPEIIDAVKAVMGQIDLDPCSNSHEHPAVPAAKHFTREDDGLSREWHGRVYMNPPYGREIEAWVRKLCAEHEARRVTEAIALVPSRTDTQWWIELRDYPVCFIEGRLTFIGNDAPAPFPSAVFYLGNHIDHFFYGFADLGDIWQRIEPGMFGE